VRVNIDELELEPDEEAAVSIQATIHHSSSDFFLQTQPADRLKILLDLSNVLNRKLTLPALWPLLMKSLFRLFPQADRGFVVRRDEKSGRLIAEFVQTRPPGGETQARFSASIVRPCLEKLEAFLSGEVSGKVRSKTSDVPESLGQHQERHIRGGKLPSSVSLAAGAVRSVMCVPLWSEDGKALGALQLDTQDARHEFTLDDLNLLLGVASQASIAVANAQLHQEVLAQEQLRRDLEMAHQVVASFQPLHLPRLDGYEFFAHYASAREVGGDYYDFVELPGGRLAVLLGDVVGKGVSAALIMVRFSVEAQAALVTEPDPAAAFGRLNGAMQRLRDADRFITLAAVVLDPARHTAQLVNAGHPLPLLLRPDAAPIEAAPRSMGGPAIGLFEEPTYSSNLLPLAPGDCLLLFSDGVTDAENTAGRQFGRKGLEATLQEAGSPRQIGQRILDAVTRHAAGCGQTDDITLICFGRTSA
jgi:serine phosphatase RsbU (regulator of sigma subunit)